MTREYMMAFGMWLICAGTGGYERYMTQHDLVAAAIDLVVSFVGVRVFAHGLRVAA